MQIREARVVLDPRTRDSRGFGFVDYVDPRVSCTWPAKLVGMITQQLKSRVSFELIAIRYCKH